MSGQEGEMLPLDDNLEMRRELFFSRGGPYADLLRSNVLLHREAADSVARIISERLDAPRRPSAHSPLARPGVRRAAGGLQAR